MKTVLCIKKVWEHDFEIGKEYFVEKDISGYHVADSEGFVADFILKETLEKYFIIEDGGEE